MTLPHKASLSLALALIPIVGCDDAAVSTQADAAASTVGATQTGLLVAPEDFITYDDVLVEVGRDVPGFGGMYLDGAGHFNVFLREVAGKSAAEVASDVISAFSRAGGVAPTLVSRLSQAPTQVLQGQFEFADLVAWKRASRALLFIVGVSFVDADESKNRVVVGVESEAVRADVLAFATRAGIPTAALEIEVVGEVQSAVSLKSGFRPFEGGYEIAISSNGHCTLGFHAVRAGTLGFVINSHCTGTTTAVDGQQFYQDSWNDSDEFIGTELVDPAPLGGSAARATSAAAFGPPVGGTPYRSSDAAFAWYGPGINSININFGKIARTEYRGHLSPGSLNRINAFDITGVAGTGETIMGLELNKVGRTTGWTYGDIVRTCTDHSPSDWGGVQLRCQYEVDADLNPGDSGSPVFTWDGSGPGGNARLFGILWGGYGDGGPNQLAPPFIFSSWNALNNELRANGEAQLTVY